MASKNRKSKIENRKLLRVEALSKSFASGGGETLEVLRGASFEVERGEVLAVVGESGTGKSTLLHLMGALDRPTGGTVVYENEDVFEQDDEALAAFRNRQVGFVFQFHHLLPEFTAAENVAMPALVQGRSAGAANERALHLLDVLDLADRAEHAPSALSGGEKQRVAMARALMNEPGLVLADEPTGNLDTKTARLLHDEILRLRSELDQTFVLATHNWTLAGIADRVLEIREGRLHDVTAEADTRE
jgi:lipoprotein-releasing system ATP-binding protein